MTAAGILYHRREELVSHLVFQQPFLVLGEARSIKSRVHDVEVEKPLEQQVIMQSFTELSLAAYRI